MRFFRNSDVTGRVVVSFGLNDPAKGLGDLLPEVDKVAASLDRSLFPAVQTGLSQAAVSEDLDAMLKGLPGMVSEADLRLLEEHTGRQQVADRLRGLYLQMMKPEGMFMAQAIRADPLAISTPSCNASPTVGGGASRRAARFSTSSGSRDPYGSHRLWTSLVPNPASARSDTGSAARGSRNPDTKNRPSRRPSLMTTMPGRAESRSR